MGCCVLSLSWRPIYPWDASLTTKPIWLLRLLLNRFLQNLGTWDNHFILVMTCGSGIWEGLSWSVHTWASHAAVVRCELAHLAGSWCGCCQDAQLWLPADVLTRGLDSIAWQSQGSGLLTWRLASPGQVLEGARKRLHDLFCLNFGSHSASLGQRVTICLDSRWRDLDPNFFCEHIKGLGVVFLNHYTTSNKNQECYEFR